MTIDLTKSQLGLISSILDETPRNPASKDAALKSIGRSAACLGLTTDHVLRAAPSLLEGSLQPEEWRKHLLAPAALPEADTTPDKTAPPQSPRAGSKQAALIGLLQRPDGATIDELACALGWQKHTVRGAIAGALKKKLGLQVESGKVEGRGRVYRLDA